MLSFKTAKEIKELGVNIYKDIKRTSWSYFSNGELHRIKGCGEFPTVEYYIVVDWLRNKHHIHVDSKQTSLGDTKFFVTDSAGKDLVEPEIYMYYGGYENTKEYEQYNELGGIEPTIIKAIKILKETGRI